MLKQKLDDLDFLYRSKSKLPKNFFYSLLFAFLFAVGATFLLYIKFTKSLFPVSKMSLDGLNIVNDNVDYIFLNVRSHAREFSDKLFNTIFAGEKFSGTMKINGKDLLDHKIFYLPDLDNFTPADLKLLTGAEVFAGKKPKTITELTIDELSILFPKIKSCDLLILDNVKLNNIEPHPDITILELNSQVIKRNYDVLHLVYTDETGAGFKVHLEQKN